MADDDPQFTPGTTGEQEPTPGPQPAAEDQDQKPDQKPEDPAQIRLRGMYDQLNEIYRRTSTRADEMQSKLDPLMREITDLANQPPPKAPVPTALPAPPTEQQKGNLSEFVFNLLKFGALTAIAYGASGRGRGHNAIFKGALGAAIDGYYSGRKDISDKSMQLWEKNREIINQANKQQTEHYKQILEAQKLPLKNKMDLLHHLATIYGDYRTAETAKAEDLNKMRENLLAQDKLQRDKEDWENKHRDKVYDVLGKGQITSQYLLWLNEKGIKLTRNSSVDDWRKVEEEHPELSFSAFLKEHDEEETKKAAQKAGAEELSRKKAAEIVEQEKAQEEKGTDSEGAKKAAKILEGLVQ